ncbi:hypothetical protein SAMN04515673_1159 [Poseidonocella sedimentorum]|uniref:Uncharacterized protein n=1 Tax=Poseidonocella sedimentorum TaxID=871652 RepID=A0A1I6EME9_9RHOB|nr:hypothetical protein SAMN04515673_1159 [Poseidonocella sedimentorum]
MAGSSQAEGLSDECLPFSTVFSAAMDIHWRGQSPCLCAPKAQRYVQGQCGTKQNVETHTTTCRNYLALVPLQISFCSVSFGHTNPLCDSFYGTDRQCWIGTDGWSYCTLRTYCWMVEWCCCFDPRQSDINHLAGPKPFRLIALIENSLRTDRNRALQKTDHSWHEPAFSIGNTRGEERVDLSLALSPSCAAPPPKHLESL